MLDSPFDNPLGLSSPFGRRRGDAITDIFRTESQGTALIARNAIAFQDVTGTTPAGNGDPLGLVLDRSQGAGYSGGKFFGLGAELFSDFVNLGDGWSDNGGGSWSCDGTQTSGSFISVNLGLTSGKGHLIQYTVTQTDGSCRAHIGAGVLESYSAASGVRAVVLSGSSASFTLQATDNFVGTVSDFSVRELPGVHAKQPVSAARRTLQQDPNGDWFFVTDQIDDALTLTFPDLGDDCTVAYVTRSEVRLLEGQTLDGAYTLPDVDLAGFVAIDRALTRSEKIRLITYLASLVQGVKYGASLTDLDLITANAVDVFVYDTSLDSDGGAWCSAVGFPSPAVLVVESDGIKIHDASDPDLPLWNELSIGTNSLLGCYALNGMVITHSSGVGVISWNFASEKLNRWITSGKQEQAWSLTGGTGPGFSTVDASSGIVYNAINDVAMTVLDDAPVDPETGLPVPTIAVATDGGVSVIRDDGSVIDITGMNDEATAVTFLGQQLLIHGNYNNFPVVIDIPETDITVPADSSRYSDATSPQIGDLKRTGLVSAGNKFVTWDDAANGDLGVYLVAHNSVDKAKGMVSRITSDFTTGWMPGDIKLAALASTDDTDLVGDLFSGFDTLNDGWTEDSPGVWSCDGTQSGNSNLVASTGASLQDKPVRVDFRVSNYISGGVRVFPGGTGSIASFKTADGEYSEILTTNSDVTAVFAQANENFVGTIDNVSFTLLDPDRSVNNIPLIVNDTVTRESVAPGAELMAYSGFSATDFLEQPYNSDLDFGTGDFCVMGWLSPGGSASDYAISRGEAESNHNRWGLTTSSNNLFCFTQGGGGPVVLTGSAVETNVFIHAAMIRKDGVLSLYKNGQLEGSVASTVDVSNPSGRLIVGNSADSIGATNAWSGSLALLRISATAPSPEQITQIYQDELKLFQPNAACTLYGSSDAVTAVAHDPVTDLLHVGTSDGRSVFDGLERVSHRPNSVSTAISAVGGLVVEK